ncbi:MAG: O-antigen ligase family protein [Anaerolineae bacterium]|nr:O-antigen ligase family protein [Anaerolineae bacterium]
MNLHAAPIGKRGESRGVQLNVASGVGFAIVEAAGLVLAVLLPSFFNARSTFSFEPDRMALLRMLAVVLAVAGFLAIPIRRPRLTPLRLAVIGWVAVQGIATLASVDVGRSFWGSEERAGGFLTSVAWALLALSLSSVLSDGGVRRLAVAVSLGSVPVTLYALAQEVGWDPVRIAVAPAQPPPAITSTLGNPIFLGGYLAMVIPLTAWLAWSEQRKAAPIALAVMQGVALVATEARGPWLGLAAGGVTAALLIGLATARRRWLVASLAALALGIVLLLAPGLALRSETMDSLRRIPYAGRLVGLWTSTTAAQRLLIWEGAARLVGSDPLRVLLGRGPETLPLAYTRYYPPRLAEYEADGNVRLPDRAHNLAWDTLAESGLLGFAATLALWGVALRIGLQRLGWRRPGEWLVPLLAAGVLGIACAGLAYARGRNTGAIGLGLGLGLWGGAIVGLGASGLRRHGPSSPLSHEQGLIIALLAALAEHFVYLQVVFVTAATGSLFWLCLAMLAAATAIYEEPISRVGSPLTPGPSPASGRGESATTLSPPGRGKGEGRFHSRNRPLAEMPTLARKVRTKQSVLLPTSQTWLPALAGLALFAFAFGLTSSAGLAALPLVAVVWAAQALWVWGLSGRLDVALWGVAALLPVALVLLVTWLADAVAWGSLAGLFLFYLAGLVGLGSVAWLTGPHPSPSSPAPLPQAGEGSRPKPSPLRGEGRVRGDDAPAVGSLSEYLPLSERGRGEGEGLPSPTYLLTLRRAGILAGGLLALFLILRPATADVLHKSGLLIATGGDLPAGIAWVTRASAWNSRSDAFRYSRARLLMFQAGEPGLSQAEVQARWAAGAEALEAGWRAHPRVAAYAGWLAEYHLVWSEEYEPDAHLAAAEGFYRQGLEIFPDNVEWRTRLGDILRRGGQYIPAQTVLMGTLARAPRYYPTYLGLGDLLKEQGETDSAEKTYRQAISVAPWAPETYLGLAEMLATEGRRDEALAVARAALRLAVGHPAQRAVEELIATLEGGDGR